MPSDKDKVRQTVQGQKYAQPAATKTAANQSQSTTATATKAKERSGVPATSYKMAMIGVGSSNKRQSKQHLARKNNANPASKSVKSKKELHSESRD